PQLQDEERGNQRCNERYGRNKCARKLSAQRSVYEEAGEGKSRDEPEQGIVHAVYAGSLAFISAGSLVLHKIDLIDVQGLACAEESDDDGKTDGGLRGGDDHDKGDEGQVDGVEHQLNRHEDRDDVALDEEGANADREQDRCEDEVVSDRNHQRSSLRRMRLEINTRARPAPIPSAKEIQLSREPVKSRAAARVIVMAIAPSWRARQRPESQRESRRT